MSEQLAIKTIAQLAPLIQQREISPVEITQSVLERTKKYDPKINAFIEICEEQALTFAYKAEKEIMDGIYRGILHGIPLALKDILYFKNERVTMGSKIHKEYTPSYDATVVSKLKEAGVVFTGKLNMHEYAAGVTTNNPHFGPCRNPWDLERIPGGSSGGSGAAVAADMTIASLGTDTGGSIRMPSAVCGIVGLKPTHGRVSKYGCFPLSWTLDHIGPMTKTVEDAAILLREIAGFDANDPTTVNVPIVDYSSFLTGNIKGKVIGIEEDYFFNEVDLNVKKLVNEGIKQLESLGAKVEIVKIPSLKYVLYSEFITSLSESSKIHQENLRIRPKDFGTDVEMFLKVGFIPSAVDYLQAQQIRRKLMKEFEEVFRKVDVLITPSTPVVAPKIGDETVVIGGQVRSLLDSIMKYTIPGNVTGLPSISVPCGFSSGLPVGMQIIGPAFKEETILNFAYAFEQNNNFQGKKPNLGELISN